MTDLPTLKIKGKYRNPVCIRGHQATYDFRRLGIYCSTCRALRYKREKAKDGLRYRTSEYKVKANKRIREQRKKNPKIRFWATQRVTKPVKVSFRTSTGEKVNFQATKKVVKPIKVEFYVR